MLEQVACLDRGEESKDVAVVRHQRGLRQEKKNLRHPIASRTSPSARLDQALLTSFKCACVECGFHQPPLPAGHALVGTADRVRAAHVGRVWSPLCRTACFRIKTRCQTRPFSHTARNTRRVAACWLASSACLAAIFCDARFAGCGVTTTAKTRMHTDSMHVCAHDTRTNCQVTGREFEVAVAY